MPGPTLNFTVLRRSEWICLAYFAYVTGLAFFIKVPVRRRFRLLAINVAAAVILFVLPAGVAITSKPFVSVVRDWFPAALLVLGYHEAGRLTRPRADQFFEKAFLRWDSCLFKFPPLGLLNPNWNLPAWLEALLEFSYMQCYVVVPSGIAVLYFAHLGRFADEYWSVVLPAVFTAFGLTPVFPAQPPRNIPEHGFARRLAPPLRRFNLWILDHASIKANTFPSGHVAGAASASLALMRILPAAGICYLVMAVGIMLGAVRGRYHYALDALAGAAVAILAFLGSMLI